VGGGCDFAVAGRGYNGGMSDTTNHDPGDDHFGPDCPQCCAMAAQAMGGMAEALQKALDDGTFERLGMEAAERRERAVLDAVLPGWDRQ
jgi:hypothetical protein